jgi:hypothetical protein
MGSEGGGEEEKRDILQRVVCLSLFSIIHGDKLHVAQYPVVNVSDQI